MQEERCGCDSPDKEAKGVAGVGRRSVLAASAAALLAGGTSFAMSPRAIAAGTEPIVQPETADDSAFIARAFEMRQRAIDLGDRAYGAVVVRDGVIIGQSGSRVILDGDPTAHAEMAAIRDAARRRGNRNLEGAVLYSSARACTMCEAAAYWARIDALVHGRAMANTGPPALC